MPAPPSRPASPPDARGPAPDARPAAGAAAWPGAGPDASPDLAPLFRPRSVALVGATERSMWSVNTFANLRHHSPDIAVHCVNPRRDRVHGVRSAPSLAAIGEPVDLAYIMSPRDTVPRVLREAAGCGAGAAIVLTAGFGETPDGRAAQRELVEVAAETGIRVLGPNGNGFVDVAGGVVPFGLRLPPLPAPGRASFVLQSGGLMKPLLCLARSWGVGVGLLANTGNEAVLSCTDVARYLVERAETGAVGLFLEAFRDPAAFRALAHRAVELDRPLVVLPVGRSEAARSAAMSHTGALTGDSAVTSAVLRGLGVVEVTSLEELLATTDLLARGLRPGGGRLAVVSASGGSCELLADQAAEQGLTLPPLPPAAVRGLTAILPEFAHVANPLDVTGYATVDPALPARAAEVVGRAGAGRFDLMLFQAFVSPPGSPSAADRAHFAGLAGTLHALPMPAVLQDEVAVGLGDFARELFAELDLVRLPGIEVGLRAVAGAVRYTARRRRLVTGPGAEAAAGTGSRTEAGADPPAGRAPLPPGPWSEAVALGLLARGGVPVVPHRLAGGVAAAVAAAREIGGRVVLKICSPDIAHKSDIGGVVLGVQGDVAVADAYAALMSAAAARAPAARIDGVLVTAFRPGGLELIAGVRRDRVWGPVLVLGFGGVLVEVLADVAIRPLPVGTPEVLEMLGELRGAALLRGARGAPDADAGAIAEAVRALAGTALSWGDGWESVEVNPLRVDGTVVEALDALLAAAPGGSPKISGRAR
ncbi:pimeloyl-CoA synthetase [Sphaerisporangium rufum]|uniref:Pimeloyl-CoA synthetase n=1 Tax=Sphaerisporangium rufum TaxID=1381558 RepID=A0A919R7C0_9ACTN|nr:acetate--CoA ligase family protein [Sphaerisporangium rufum]GII78560.1 pimeloyl-CoA synthetase [Sphaerisporangium rufum]